ncbi:hypothetical protein DDZ13_10255 [Coraliomargarita sinensis]|uniref:Glycosyltransferase WbuB n=1 Tax=Coraliomargarita sinensis TaxID=2174842 RepID=A0A317ZIE1_9BACT|nr:glycosyltransferase family 4 protein [Coraliomargarita sinensis]PXA03668.1 hypothetical protein DDZ13_10255 [Coraliomargarita sinensis]
MNIWLINPFSDLPNEGASEGRFCCLARMLVEQGHHVTWWTVDFHHRTKARREPVFEGGKEEKWEGNRGGSCQIFLLPVPGYKKNISFARVRSHRAYGREFAKTAEARIAEGERPDVIHLSTPPLDCIAPVLQLRQRIGCRVTVDVMDLWPETFYRTLPQGLRCLGKILFAPLHGAAKRAYKEADGISAVSQEYLDHVSEVRGRGSGVGSQPSDLHLCYVGGERLPAPCSAPHAPRFLYVGAMTPTYDLPTILEAAESLQKDGHRFEVWFAGGGVSEPVLKAEVERRQLSGTVKFLGFLNQEELKDVLGRADVGLNAINPGAYITMPHKLSDYLCAGLAVINSTTGEPAELLRQADAGCTYTAGHVASLRAGMKHYINQPEALEQQRENARQLAQKYFDRNKTYSAMIDFILGK